MTTLADKAQTLSLNFVQVLSDGPATLKVPNDLTGSNGETLYILKVGTAAISGTETIELEANLVDGTIHPYQSLTIGANVYISTSRAKSKSNKYLTVTITPGLLDPVSVGDVVSVTTGEYTFNHSCLLDIKKFKPASADTEFPSFGFCLPELDIPIGVGSIVTKNGLTGKVVSVDPATGQTSVWAKR
jgi:hypothetical protein